MNDREQKHDAGIQTPTREHREVDRAPEEHVQRPQCKGRAGQPDRRPGRDVEQGFAQELHHQVAAPRPEGLAHTDLDGTPHAGRSE